MKTENINNYSEMSIEDLEELKKNLLNQKSDLNHTIEEVINNIRFKKVQTSDDTLRLNPYYKDESSYLKVVISDKGGYIITRIVPCGACMGICQYSSLNTSDYLKYYEICSKSDWENAIDRLNMWFKDASLKVKEL